MRFRIKLPNEQILTVNVDADLLFAFQFLTQEGDLNEKIAEFKKLLQSKVDKPGTLNDVAVVLKIFEGVGKVFEYARKKAEELKAEVQVPSTNAPIRAIVEDPKSGEKLIISVDSELILAFQMLTGGENLSTKIKQFKNVLKRKVIQGNRKKLDDIAWALKVLEAIGMAFEEARKKAEKIEVVFDPPLEEEQ